MATILLLETSTEVCSAALSINGKIVASREDSSGRNHAMQLTLFIDEVVHQAKISIQDLDAVAVSAGPGSYTGLRIGVSTAKGLCYGLHKPMIAIPSLEAMAHHVIDQAAALSLPNSEEMLFCPMIDARRMEVYTALFQRNKDQIKETCAEIIDNTSFSNYLNDHPIAFFGNGSSKCKAAIQHPNAIFLDHILASANYLAPLAEKAFNQQNFVDVAYYEPFYLKDFIATVPTKNIIHTGSNL